MISSPEECGYDLSDGHTGNVTGGMEDKMQPVFLLGFHFVHLMISISFYEHVLACKLH